MGDIIEYWNGDNLVVAVNASMVPAVDSFINIQGTTWKVEKVTYTVDHSNSPQLKHMRANVDLVAIL